MLKINYRTPRNEGVSILQFNNKSIIPGNLEISCSSLTDKHPQHQFKLQSIVRVITLNNVKLYLGMR